MTQTIAVRPMVVGARTGEMLIARPAVVEPDMTVELVRRSAPGTVVTTLASSYERRFTDQLNEPGSASLSLQNDDADLAELSDDDLINFKVKGFTAFTLLPTEYEQYIVAEEPDRRTVVSGPGHLAVLEEAVVYPVRGPGSLPIQEDRTWNWSAPDFNDTGWPTAKVIQTVASPLPGNEGWWAATSWDDQTAAWVWANQGTEADAPPGTCYFRHTFTTDYAGKVALVVTIDNGGEAYFDGQRMVECDDLRESFKEEFEISAGAHTIAIAGTNAPFPDGGTINPGGLICSLYKVLTDGTFGDVITNSASGNWKVAEYPPYPPGMSVGEILRKCVQEAQARGALLDVTLQFNDDTDAKGIPWPIVTDVTTKVGTDVLTFFRELSATYIDLWMAPGRFALYAWNFGGRGSSKGIEFSEGTNLLSLERQRKIAPISATLVRWVGGWRERAVTKPIRREALLGLGAAQSTAEADRVADSQLSLFGDPRSAIQAEIAPTSAADTPYLGFRVGDSVIVPDPPGTSRERVVAIEVSEDTDTGRLVFKPELKDLIPTPEEALQQAVKKMSNGTFRGASKVATPVSDIRNGPQATVGGSISGYEACFSAPGALVPQYSPPIVTPVTCSLEHVIVTVRTVAATFRVRVLRDGVEVVNQVIAADADYTDIDCAPQASAADDTQWVVHILDCSVTTVDVNVSLRFDT